MKPLALLLAATVATAGLAAAVPGDALRDRQHALEAVHAPDAWPTATGEGVRVAVVDTGLDHAHADLAPRTASGEGESVAEPAGSYARLPLGPWNTTQDTHGHGTRVAGLVAAERGNGAGIAGVSRATLIPVKVEDVGVVSDADTLARGIEAAVGAGADVVQVSQVTREATPRLEEALRAAEAEGALVVAAAGNRDRAEPAWPAAAGTVVAVGAVDADGQPWTRSHDGVDLAAPGVEVLTTALGNRYDRATGTSLAAPVVSGVAALALDACPSLTPDGARGLLNETAEDVAEPGYDEETGWGLVRADRAVEQATPCA